MVRSLCNCFDTAATENSNFTGSVGADCVQVVLHLRDLQTLFSTWKPLLASTYPWGMLRQPDTVLHLKDTSASGVCIHISIWWPMW